MITRDIRAQDEEELEMELFFAPEETVTSAARHAQDIGMSPSAITVINREEIEASGATSIPDLLRLVPGMDVVLCSPFYTSVSTRLYWNFENNLFLVLVDGREVNLELIGWAPWEIEPLNIEEIERIEVIRGPASSLYGANAFAGVISITTRPIADQASGWMRMSGGEIGMLSAAARASARIGDWGILVSAGRDLMGRYTDARQPGKEVWKLRSAIEYRLSESDRLLLDWGISEGEGANTSAMGTVNFGMDIKVLRLAYKSENLDAQVFWNMAGAAGGPKAGLEFEGIKLAKFRYTSVDAHTIDGQVQWTLPRFWHPLLVIVGGGLRGYTLISDELLNGETYSDISSPDFHKPGLNEWEYRTGAFAQAELSLVDWLTITAGLRFDYNNITKEFFSPRIAAVFKPVSNQYLRLSVARAFRKPAYLETGFHMAVEFPQGSPITGPAQNEFQEFMSKMLGNKDLFNEQIISFEAGYLGRFLDGKIDVSLDLYANLYRDLIEIKQDIVRNAQGLPDLREGMSTFRFENTDKKIDIFGSELSLRYQINRKIVVMASWTLRQVYNRKNGTWENRSPKNMFKLGGRFQTDFGLLGSLYIFSRSEFIDPQVENPAGLFQPYLTMQMDNSMLILARLGYKFRLADDFQLEAGLKLFLPFSLDELEWHYYEKGGSVAMDGGIYGGDRLRRMLTAYIIGSF